MQKLIDIDAFPIRDVLNLLLKDKTTKQNIIFATDAYIDEKGNYSAKHKITLQFLKGLNANELQPRVLKSMEEQVQRTRTKAEVFTPSWICNKMNNHCDAEWFGRESVFNIENDQTWEPTPGPIQFDDKRTWKKYVDSKRLEITCGEAPYIVSRYDAATGEMIPINRRIGILDRKLRVVGENAEVEKQWMEWCIRAFQSVYGYEFQGDNLLIARINLLMTFKEYLEDRWHRPPTDEEIKKIANIIVWNIWQMDGITGTVPFGKPSDENRQLSFFDYIQGDNEDTPKTDCKIFDWRSNRSVTYNSLKG